MGKVFLEEAKTTEAKWLKNSVKHESTKGEIRWRSIPKFKGLESEVVVITDIGEEAVEFFNSRGQSPSDWLYVGISRARHRCVLITTKDIKEVLKPPAA